MLTKSPTLQLPVFDLAKPQPVKLRKALKKYGFFYLRNAVDKSLLERAFEQTRLFFDLSIEEKMKLHMDDRYRGYDPGNQTLRLQNLSPEEAEKLQRDLKESFRLWDPHQRPIHRDVPWRRLFGHPNNYPPEQLLPDFRKTMLQYRRAMTNTMSRVMEVAEESLELPKGLLTQYDDPGFRPVRMLSYPREHGGSNAHSDWGFFTGLNTDTWGLQILMPGDSDNGMWYDVPPLEGCAVINVGDMLTTLTEGTKHGKIIATRHRVVMSPKNTAKNKITLVVFDYGHRKELIGGKQCAEIILDKFDQSYGYGPYAAK